MQKDLESKGRSFTLKVGEGGRTFGSVSTKEIAEEAKNSLDLDIDKKETSASKPDQKPGRYTRFRSNFTRR